MGVAADLVLTGGRVWRGLAEGFCEAAAIWGGRVLATGAVAEIAPLIGPTTRVIDLRGRLATPGLNDAHMHLLPYGLVMLQVDLRPAAAPTLAALLDALAARARATPPGQWILGRGYDHFSLDVGRHPRREELDAACPDHPVFIVRTDGHLAVASSAALALAGVGPGTNDPDGGVIGREGGALTGLLAERALDLVQAVIPAPDADALVDAIERAGCDALSRGITSVMDAAVGMVAGWAEMLAYQRARREGRLPLRVWLCLLGDPDRSILPQAMAAGMVTGLGDAHMRIGPVKIFTDGSFGGRTAAMSRPYAGGDAQDLGVLCLPDDAVRDAVIEAHAAGYSMAVHAIGDRAIEQVLQAMEVALDAMPDPGRRHRIEHCGWLTPGQMDRMAARGIVPAPQPAFHYYFGDNYLSLTDPAAAAASYPFRTWVERGMNPSASTDCPVCDLDPMPNLYAMLTRRTRKGVVLGADQTVDMAQALHAYTWAGAWAEKQEGVKGRLVPGQLADVAVWSEDLFALAPEELFDVRCDLTILDGRVVHEAA